MSIGELLGLLWENVNFADGTILVRTKLEQDGRGVLPELKNKFRKRTLRMSPEVRAALTAQKKFTFMKKGGVVFESPYTNEPFRTPKDFTQHIWASTLKRAGVPHRGANEMRHTYAADKIAMYKTLADLWKLSRDLGHTGLDMIYRHYGGLIENREHEMKEDSLRSEKHAAGGES